jgi:hypothetical protein
MHKAPCMAQRGRAIRFVDRVPKTEPRELRLAEDHFLRWRILARMRRFLRPSFRRPLPDFLVPKDNSDVSTVVSMRRVQPSPIRPPETLIV